MTTVPAAAILDHAYIRHPRLWVALICLLYLVIATNFALQTPRWQAPDEPAHYNYIAHLVTTGTLPILQRGDYDQAYRDYLLKNRFPADGEVERLRYENYQPPLYYLLGAVIHRATGGDLLALRMFNVGLGLILLLLFYATVAKVFPERHLLSVGATAFAALLPMHVAVTAAINNDVLAEVLVAASLYLLLAWARLYFERDHPEPIGSGSTASPQTMSGDSSRPHQLESSEMAEPEIKTEPKRNRQLIWLGILLGLGLLTKIYAYALVPLCLLAIVLVRWRAEASWRGLWQGVQQSLYTLVPALVLALPWWVRNGWLYGRWDLLGLEWHDQVVAGQPTTAEWIATHGFVSYSERALNFTFQSFWGVFGWLGVFMDGRIYTAFLAMTGVLFLGLLWTMIRLISGKPDSGLSEFQRWVLLFFILLVAAVAASYVWYNLKFVQHQGRYFFWGLLPISTFVALGWREVMRPLQGIISGLLALILLLALTFTGYINGGMNKWTVLTIGLITLVLLLQPLLFASGEGYRLAWLPRWLQQLATARTGVILLRMGRFTVWALPFLLLAALDLLIPTLYIVPQLTP